MQFKEANPQQFSRQKGLMKKISFHECKLFAIDHIINGQKKEVRVKRGQSKPANSEKLND
jgi:hypothetical protein